MNMENSSFPSCLSGQAPPMIRTFQVEEIGDSYSILRWDRWTSADMEFVYEIGYQVEKIDQKYPKRILHLPRTQSATLLRDLKSNTTYMASISALNECARSNQLVQHFRTLPSNLHAAITTTMPHEIFLTIVVFIMWFCILRRFFVIYSRVTFLHSPSSIYQRNNCDGNEDTVQKVSVSSLASKISKCSTTKERYLDCAEDSANHKFSLLEDAVHAWRSETVLSKVELLDGMEMRRPFELDRLSIKSDTKENKTITSSFHPRNQNRISSSPSPSTTEIEEQQSQKFVNNRKSFQHSILMPPVIEVPLQDQDRNQEVQLTRKISEVLLGKATKDIRRQSSHQILSSKYLKRLSETNEMIRKRPRLSFSTIRWKSFRGENRKRKKMESVSELEEMRYTNHECESTHSQRPLLLPSTSSSSSTYRCTSTSTTIDDGIQQQEWNY